MRSIACIAILLVYPILAAAVRDLKSDEDPTLKESISNAMSMSANPIGKELLETAASRQVVTLPSDRIASSDLPTQPRRNLQWGWSHTFTTGWGQKSSERYHVNSGRSAVKLASSSSITPKGFSSTFASSSSTRGGVIKAAATVTSGGQTISDQAIKFNGGTVAVSVDSGYGR